MLMTTPRCFSRSVQFDNNMELEYLKYIAAQRTWDEQSKGNKEKLFIQFFPRSPARVVSFISQFIYYFSLFSLLYVLRFVYF